MKTSVACHQRKVMAAGGRGAGTATGWASRGPGAPGGLLVAPSAHLRTQAGGCCLAPGEPGSPKQVAQVPSTPFSGCSPDLGIFGGTVFKDIAGVMS